jgi:hypothetical protein
MLWSAISCIIVLWYADADAENTSPGTQRSRCWQATMSQLGGLCCNMPEEDLQEELRDVIFLVSPTHKGL